MARNKTERETVSKEPAAQPKQSFISRMTLRDKECLVLLGLFIIGSGLSLYDCRSYSLWVLEAGPALLAALVLMITYKFFPLTRLAYYLILIHSFVLLIGAHWGYAHVPFGEWAMDWFGWERNHYDRLGHIAFGFFPVVVVREVLVRTTPLKRGKMLFFLAVCVIGAAGAFYEVLEWVVSVVTNDPSFAATQGDAWDPQKDMALAFAGAIAGQALFLIIHTKEMIKRGYVTPAEAGDAKERSQEEVEQEIALKEEYEDFVTKWKHKMKRAREKDEQEEENPWKRQ